MPLTSPLRLEIKKRIKAALEEITPANGYVLDFSPTPTERVFRGRAVYGADDPLPMLSILEVPIPLDLRESPINSTYSSGGWELMIQGFVKDDPVNPTDPADIALADVKKRLVLERKKTNTRPASDGPFGLGRIVTGLNLGAGVVRPPDEISAKAYFWLTMTLELAEDLEEPYGEN